MKFTPSRNTVISTADTKQFTMAVNAKSFSILTSGIYKNKIKAVIREYSTNALDSHIEAGNPEPFEVHLPTEKECYFYVRDYGTGLDEEQFEAVFFKFFESTKDKSNEYNGTMGLGSKSLYSYNSKSFTVESWKNGYHYIYSCFIGQSGVPEYSQLAKEYSQDPEGVKVQASVNPEDIEEFEENAEEVYKYFTVKPKFVGKQINVEDIYKDSNNLFSIKQDSYYEHSGSYAIMGNVAYPIENNYQLNKHKSLVNSNLLIFFDIGELTFTPSRESLEYTDYTIKNLKSKFNKVLDYINSEITSKINNAKSEFEAVKLYNSLYYEYRRNVKGLEKPTELKWNGKLLNTNPIKINTYVFNFTRKSKQETKELLIGDYNYIVDDLKVGAISRCLELRESTKKVTYLLSEDNLKDITLNYNDNDLIKASTLPKPQKVVKKRSSLSSFSEMLNSYYLTESWKTANINDAQSKYYIIRNGYRPVYNGEKSKPDIIYRYALNAGIKEIIYGVSEKQEKEIINLGFINIYDAITEKVKNIKKELEDNKLLITKLKTYNVFLSQNSNIFKIINNINNKYSLKNKDLLELINFKNSFNIKDLNFFIDKINNLVKIGESVKFDYDTNLVKKYQAIIDKYPMLSINFGYYTHAKISDLDYYHYILGVEHASGNV